MNGEKSNNFIDNKTVEQIRQSPDYAWLVDSLDVAFKDNVWTGFQGEPTVDKFMEAVFGEERARAVPEDIRQQFYEDYLSKIQELRSGQNKTDVKAKKLTEDNQIENLQKEVEYYEDLRPVNQDQTEDWEKRRADLLEQVRNGKKKVETKPSAIDWKKLNQELVKHLGSSFQEASIKEKPELLDKTIKMTDSLWRYFVNNKKWVKALDKKRNNQEGVYLKDFSDCNAKAVLLLVKKSGLEQALINNWDKTPPESFTPQSWQDNLSKMSGQTSSAEVMYHLLQDQGILKNKDEALRLMVGLATKSMHYELVDSQVAWQGSGLSLRGLHRAFNQQQQYVYLKERINNFLELKKWRQPLSKKQQIELEQELLNEPVDKSLAAKLVNNGKQEEMMSRLDRVGKEQTDIINQAIEVLDKSDEELIKSGQLAVTGKGERWFINQHKKDDKSFGGAVAVRAYGFDGFINYDADRGGYLAASFKSDSNLADKVNLPGANKVNQQMVMHQGKGQNKISLKQLLKEVLPDYQPADDELPTDKPKSFIQLDKEPDELPEKFEYNGLQFSRVLTDEELNNLQFLDEVVKSFVEDSVNQVIEQKYGHLDELAKEKILTEMVDKGMNHPKILEQRRQKCLQAKLPLIIDK